jgi:uncharacterized cupin superfamily protein
MSETPNNRHAPPLNHADVKSRPAKSPYPPPYNDGFHPDMTWKPVGAMFGLTNFGVNIVTLPPGGRSAERHWHKAQDEFVYVIEGTVTVMSEAGETPFSAGQCIGFKAGVEDGHMLENKSTAAVTYLCVGDRSNPEHVTYPDVDMQLVSDEKGPRFLHSDGTPYPDEHQPKWG